MRLRLSLPLLLAAACRTPAPAGPAPGAPAPALQTFDASALDRSASPCDDFYRFACGGWLDRSEIPPDRSRWGWRDLGVRARDDRCLRASSARGR